ncbi:MAG: GNAT family N-acetyltransferase [Acidobacteriota bacterium]
MRDNILKRKEIQIRELGGADLPAVHALWAEAGLPFHPEGRDALSRMAEELRGGSAALLGAFSEGILAGVVLLTDDGRKGWINRLAVKPSFRRRGVGKALIAAGEALLLRRGRGIVACLVEDWNEASLSLFQSQGYELRRDIFYLRKVPGGSEW